MPRFIRRNVTLAPEDINTVRRHAQEWGLSFSAALRLIIREWKHSQPALSPAEGPTHSQPAQAQDQTEALH
jgi:hypothetical protein